MLPSGHNQTRQGSNTELIFHKTRAHKGKYDQFSLGILILGCIRRLSRYFNRTRHTSLRLYGDHTNRNEIVDAHGSDGRRVRDFDPHTLGTFGKADREVSLKGKVSACKTAALALLLVAVTGLFYAGFKAPDFETAIRKRHSVWMQTITVRALIGLNGWTEHVSILHASNYVKRQCPLAKHLVLVFRERHFLADRGDRIVHRDDRRCGVGIVGVIFHCSICSLLKWPDDIPGVGVFGVNGWRSPLVLNVHRHQDVINTINHCNCTGSLLTISYNFKCASRSWREIGALFHSELPLREAESVPAGFGGVFSGVRRVSVSSVHLDGISSVDRQQHNPNDLDKWLPLIPPVLFMFASNLIMGMGWRKLRTAHCWHDIGLGLAGLIIGFPASVWGWVVFGDRIF